MKAVRRGIGFLAATLLALLGSVAIAGAAPNSSRAPFTDPNAIGYIGLCNEAGHQITSGSIYTTPLAWRAVSSEKAPAPYSNAWRTAILLAYQPIDGVPSGEWSGDELTASSRYTNPGHPMAAATGGDDSLEDFIEEYKPRWDGYLELRMYLGTKNAPVYSFHYPALAVKVTGATWHAVGGGPVNCRSGTAESLETMLLPKSATSPPTTVHPGGSGSPAGVASAASASRAISSRSSNHLVIAAVIVIVLAVLAALSLLIARRRRPAISPSIAVTTRSSTKGHRP